MINPGISSPYASEAEIGRLAVGLLRCTLPKAEWTHAAHFAATLWLMRHRSDLDLVAAMPGIIRAYNESAGGRNSDTEGYHETITQASLAAARAFLIGRPGDEGLHRVIGALMASPLGKPDWILAFWSRERLSSVEARRGWVDPDLQTLRFDF
jgi:hypothetical protein